MQRIRTLATTIGSCGLRAALLSCLVLAPLRSPVNADDFFWNGNGLHSWGNSLAWTHQGAPGDFFPLDDGMTPGSSDFAYIQNGDTVNVNVNTSGVDALTVSGGSQLSTGGNQLLVTIGDATGKTTISGAGSIIEVDSGFNGSDFDTDILDVIAGGRLSMDGGFAQVDNNMWVRSDSSVTGHGTIHFRDNNDTNGTHLDLNGTLTVTGGDLTLRANHGGNMDLDGTSGTTVINVTSGNNRLTVEGLLSDAFSGTMNIGSTNTANMVSGWDSNGTINMTGGSLAGGTFSQSGGAVNVNSGTNRFAAPVDLSSGSFTVAGGATARFEGGGTLNSMTIGGTGTLVADSVLDVTGGLSRIDSTARFDSAGGTRTAAGSTLILARNPRFNPGSLTDVDGTLRLFSPATYAGGAFTGDGTVSQQASVIVTANTTMNLNPASGVYDWDGAADQNEMTTVNSGRTFRINANRLNPSTGASKNHYTGRLNINGGRVEVNTADPWQVVSSTSAGEIHFNSFAGTATLAGQDLSVSGAGTEFDAIFGQAVVDANIDFDDLADVRILNSGSGFTFEKDVSFSGTTIHQDIAGGRVVFDGNVDVSGNTVVNATEIDWDGTQFGSETTTIRPGASLTLNTDKIDLTPAAIDGNDNAVFIQAGVLTVNTVDPWRMDGALTLSTVAGQAQVNGSPLRMVSSGSSLTVTGGNAGSINVPLTLDGNAGVSINGSSRLHLNGPSTIRDTSMIGAGSLVFDNAATIDAPADINVGTFRLSNDGNVNVEGGTIVTTNFDKDPAAVFDHNGGTFEVAGGTATFNSSHAYSGGTAIADQPRFLVSDGGDAAVTFSWRVGENAGEFGETIVTGTAGGSPSTLRGTGGGQGADLVVGRSGTGRLEVSDGGRTEIKDDLIVANNAGSAGTVFVNGVSGGVRSTIDQTGRGASSSVNIGREGDGRLTVANGALVDVGGDLVVGSTSTGQGIVDIIGSAGGFNAEVRVGQDLVVHPGGRVNVRSGGKLDVEEEILFGTGAIVTVSGTGNLDPHLLTVDGATFNVEPTATVVVSDAGATSDPGFFVGFAGGDGQVVVKNGGALSTGAVQVGGEIETGQIDIDASSSWAIDGPLVVKSGGVVHAEGTVSPDRLIVESGGSIGGSGDVDATLVNSGLLSPGDSPGILSAANFVQETTGTLLIELGGLVPGSEYDVLDVNGLAELDGTLEIALLDQGGGTFAPAEGDAFSILSAGVGITGTFASVIEPALPEGLVWDLLYQADEVLLSVMAATAGLPADFDGDGDVDGEDFLAWQTGFGITGDATQVDGDADGDGDVDGEDFLAWQASFGDLAGDGGRVTGAVPEPTAAMLILLVAVVALARRPRG